MLMLPETVIQLLKPFRHTISRPQTWAKIHVLVIGAVLTTGKRTVSTALQVMGMGQERNYAKYHQVLSRAVWRGLQVSQVLLGMLVERLWDKQEALVIGIDETLERRASKQLEGCGYYRDGVRSKDNQVVKTRGLRWVSLMVLLPIAWAQRVWALPFLTILAYSEAYYQRRGRGAKSLTDWARQALLQVHRWVRHVPLVIVGDAAYARAELFHLAHRLHRYRPFTLLTRVRFDVALYAPPPPRPPGHRGRPRKKGQRLPPLSALCDLSTTVWTPQQVMWYDQQLRTVHLHSFLAVWSPDGTPPVMVRCLLVRTFDSHGTPHTQALLCSDLTFALSDPLLLAYFMRRWQLEVTFQLVRTHLGVETQRQWSPLAIARTTPALLGLFSFVTLLAHTLLQHTPPSSWWMRTAWYPKGLPTFADALALVRAHLWQSLFLSTSTSPPDLVLIPRPMLDRIQTLITYAA